MSLDPRRIRAALGAVMAVAFAAVGTLFVVLPGPVLRCFDVLSRRTGFAPFAGPLDRFWLVLAAAYMYLVTVLAWSIRRDPDDPTYPRLLAHAKLASAALSALAFVFLAQHLILLANAVVDGTIGALAVWLWRHCPGRAGGER